MSMLKRRQPTLMSKKYYSMLLGGTLTMMMSSLMVMSDSLIAGAVIGADAVAGVTLVTPLYSFVVFIGTLFSLGIPILYSKEMGRFRKKEADRIFGFGVLMTITVGIIMFIAISFLGDIFLQSSSPRKEVLTYAKEYLFWMRLTFLVMPFQMLLSEIVNGDGDEFISTIANVIQGLGNITLSIVLSRFIGMRGIGFASFIFYIISLLILLIHFGRKRNSLRWNLYFSFGLLKKVLRYGIIDASSFLYISILTATFNGFISNQFGSKYLILASVITLCREGQFMFDGIGEAVCPIFGVYVGEKNHKGLRTSYALARRTAVVEGLIVTVALLIIAPYVPGFLNVTNPEMARWIVIGVRLTAIGSTFTSLLYLITSYYLTIDQIKIGVIVCAMRDVVFSVLLGVALGKIFGVAGMFAGLGVAPAVACGIFMLVIRLRYGKDDCPLLLSKVPGHKNITNFEISVDPKKIIRLQQEVGSLLEDNKVDTLTINRVKLLIEELYMLIWEKNNEKAILGEITIYIDPDQIRIISKDNGVLFDISEEDVDVTSITSYLVSAYMEKLGENRQYLTTMSFNRSTYVIKTQS